MLRLIHWPRIRIRVCWEPIVSLTYR
jgi:hypothetical protein